MNVGMGDKPKETVPYRILQGSVGDGFAFGGEKLSSSYSSRSSFLSTSSTADCGTIRYFTSSNSTSIPCSLRKIAQSPSLTCSGIYRAGSFGVDQGSSSV